MTQSVSINYFSHEFKSNPYPTYQQLIAEKPVAKTILPDGREAWLVSNYELASSVLKDSRFIKDSRKLTAHASGERAKFVSVLAFNMLSIDPPEHTRLRAVVSKAFTPRLIEGLRPRIQQITDDLLDGLQERGAMDLIRDFAFPLPIQVICEMLGIPAADRDKFRAWSNTIVSMQNGISDIENAQTTMSNFIQYLAQEFERRNQQPQDDLISALLTAESEGQRLSREELYAMVILLIVAGHETTMNLIANGTLALLLHPDQLAKLKDNPGLSKNAVEEILRYDGPVEWATSRWANGDIELGGQTIHKGEMVIVILNAADHDPARFTNPDELDIEREISNHLAFGQGIHYCLGAPLARLEGQIAFETLFKRMPNLQLAIAPEQLRWHPSLLLRGLVELPVTF